MGQVLVLGQGDVGQLGLGEDILQRKKPAPVTLPEGTLQVTAGVMHTVCLSDTGSVREHLSYHISFKQKMQRLLPCQCFNTG